MSRHRAACEGPPNAAGGTARSRSRLAAIPCTLACAGLLSLLHHNLQHLAEALLGHIGLAFELRHLMHKPTAIGAIVRASNLAVVGFLAWRIRHQPRRSAA